MESEPDHVGDHMSDHMNDHMSDHTRAKARLHLGLHPGSKSSLDPTARSRIQDQGSGFERLQGSSTHARPQAAGSTPQLQPPPHPSHTSADMHGPS